MTRAARAAGKKPPSRRPFETTCRPTSAARPSALARFLGEQIADGFLASGFATLPTSQPTSSRAWFFTRRGPDVSNPRVGARRPRAPMTVMIPVGVPRRQLDGGALHGCASRPLPRPSAPPDVGAPHASSGRLPWPLRVGLRRRPRSWLPFARRPMRLQWLSRSPFPTRLLTPVGICHPPPSRVTTRARR